MQRISLLIAIACLGVALAACGGSDSETVAPTQAPAGATAAATTAATKAAATAAATKAAATVAATAKPATTQGKLPADACALVTLDEVHALAPTAGGGKASPQQGVPGQSVIACRWEWPEGVGSLDVIISTIPSGLTEAELKSGLQATVAGGRENGRELSDIGDVAIFKSAINADATVQAIVHGLQLDIDLNVLGARAQQDQLIAFAKLVASRF